VPWTPGNALSYSETNTGTEVALRVVVPILLVLIAAYGATITLKPHLAVRRSQPATPMALMIARFKGIIAFVMAAFMLWRTQ
jgi:hypothetical protein